MPNFNKKKFFEWLKKTKKNNKIILSTKFDVLCERIQLNNNQKFVIKSNSKKKPKYNIILHQGKSYMFLQKKFPDLFPKIHYLNKDLFVMSYISNNKIKNKDSEKDLAIKISRIHKCKNNKFGFKYNTPIGGFEQPCKFQKSWVDFFENQRLVMIYEKINKTNPMPKKINIGIEKIIKNLKNLIPNNPKPSLIHGDLWNENMLFDNGKLVGLIDPGINYAHKEIEIAYLKWLKTISMKFYNYYAETINFDKFFFHYSKVYELYYFLMSVHNWKRSHINQVAKLVSKFD